MRKTAISRLAALALAGALALTACSGSSQPSQETSVYDGTNMEALIAAAQAEGEVVAYWASSRIEGAGKAFEAKYGIKVTGTKLSDTESTERILREVDSKNVLADVVGTPDGARLANDLIPNGYVENYIPTTGSDVMDPAFKDPMIYAFDINLWGYNTESYPNGCPITNIWQLTEPEWKGNLHMLDPKLRAMTVAWMVEIEKHSDQLAAAYQELKGAPIELTEANAGLEFIKRLAQNEPILHNGDEEIAAAIGTRGQEKPPVGQYSLSRHRDNEKLDHALGFCDFTPIPAYSNPVYMGIISGAKHPNAARLLFEFLMTQEGMDAWVNDPGWYSVVPGITVADSNPFPSLEAWGDRTVPLTDIKTTNERRGPILDLWTKANG
jgi:iron(III) transport system substrate-binding protein